MKKLSAVCCTYGRFKYVERVINFYLQQTYPYKELILFNTDTESPYIDEPCVLAAYGILIVNNSIDMVTKQPYTNVGAIRRDALKFASGELTVTWDDDDSFMPYFMQQAVDRMEQTGLPSFKPEKSFFYSGGNLRLVMNTMEASVVASMEKVREYGYLLETGKEGLGWYTKMRDNKELDEHDKYYIPSYCFDWNTTFNNEYVHRQSGDIDNTDNFNNHKSASKDAVNDRRIAIYDEEKMREIYQPYFDFIRNNEAEFPQELIEKYFKC